MDTQTTLFLGDDPADDAEALELINAILEDDIQRIMGQAESN